MKISMAVLFLAVTIFGSACQNRRTMYDTNSFSQNEEGGLRSTIVWVKNKPKSIDMQIRFTNNYKEEILIKQESMTLEFSGQKVGVRSGYGSIYLPPGATTEHVAVFNFYGYKDQRAGDATLRVDRIVKSKDEKALKPLKMTFTVQDPVR